MDGWLVKTVSQWFGEHLMVCGWMKTCGQWFSENGMDGCLDEDELPMAGV